MRSIAIVGSGIAGLLTAHGLLRAGHAVTLFSDRTAEQWLREARPTGTAGRFEPALAYERELDLHHWEHEAPRVMGVHCTFCPELGNRLLTLTGRIEKPFMAIDVRLQCHRWMNDLVERGGKLVVEGVTVPRLDAIAATHDLTIVATGKAELAELFDLDTARSVYQTPQRHVAMVIARASSVRFAEMPFVAVKFNILGPAGEALWTPYHHCQLGPSWNLLFEARAHGPMDVFGDARSGAEVLDRAKRVIRDLVPWDWPWARNLELADENGWQVGRFAPRVRRPVGRLPSGRVVTCVGDTAMLFDPIGAQGANNGTRMARHMVASIVAHGDRPFDPAWMTRTFEDFYAEHGRAAYTFNNLLLEPALAPSKELLIAQYGSDGHRSDARQAMADAFAANFVDPRRLTHVLQDLTATRSFIAHATGHSWLRSAIVGRLAIARGQLRQRLGLSPGHPLEGP